LKNLKVTVSIAECRFGVLADSANPNTPYVIPDLQAAARARNSLS
jgi:hypothetical protein